MTISELIDILKLYPGNAEVRIPDMNYCDWTDAVRVTYAPLREVVQIHSEAM